MTYHAELIGKIAEVLEASPEDHPFKEGAKGVVVCVDDDGSVWVKFDYPCKESGHSLYVVGDVWHEGKTFNLLE